VITGLRLSVSGGADLNDVIGEQRILILGICVYLCVLPVLVAANLFLNGTSGKPTVTPVFGIVLALGLSSSCLMWVAPALVSFVGGGC
jgi:hypothetical protein